MISIPKGTKDILPDEAYKWQRLEAEFREICESFGFREIRTPVFEHTELFRRGVGESTDIVQKEMYTFEIAGRSLTLKPEGTAGVVRSFVENKLYAGTMPAKYYYLTPCFRYEKMQKGRQRQFHQFGIEIFGSSDMLADAEIMGLTMSFFEKLGIEDLKLKINSIGCPDCRAGYRKMLQDFLRPSLDELCDTCKDRFERNPLRILDCKSPICKAVGEDAPRMMDFLCGECRDAFDKLKMNLEAMGLDYEVDSGIVRGLDYYTKTAFEIVSDKLGAQSTVCGGGRYDYLIEEMDGPYTPGVGMALGVERLLLILEASGIEIPEPENCDVFVAFADEAARPEAVRLSSKLRAAGIKTMMDVAGRGLKAQFKYADRQNALYTIVIGSDEVGRGVVQLRNMKDSSQKEVPFADIVRELKNI